MKESIDPRVNRLKLATLGEDQASNAQWITYEVFHQEKRGKQSVHVGVVHAASPELALVLAKEQYARRGKTANVWVVKSSDVFTFPTEDDDIFETTVEKKFRAPGSYKVRDRISAFKKKQGIE